MDPPRMAGTALPEPPAAAAAAQLRPPAWPIGPALPATSPDRPQGRRARLLASTAAVAVAGPAAAVLGG